VCDRKDYVSFVLVGCDTDEIKTEDASHPNVLPFGEPRLCSWQLLLEFFQFVNKTACEDGEWLNGLQAALELQNVATTYVTYLII